LNSLRELHFGSIPGASTLFDDHAAPAGAGFLVAALGHRACVEFASSVLAWSPTKFRERRP
jgi:hypothetical protein